MSQAHEAAGSADDLFLERFRAAAIPPEDWNHEAHLRMAFVHLGRYEFRDAVRRIRRGIRRLNRANGVADTETGGYHETLTLAWARIVAGALAAVPAAGDFASFLARYPELRSTQRVLRHYSPERIGSRRARREFVLPDRAPLPDFGRPALTSAVRRAVQKRSPGRKDSAPAAADIAPRRNGHD